MRLIEDTEICLYNTKPLEEAHNQLWGVRDDAVDAYGRPLPGSYIYSSCNNEWVLDTQPSTEKDTQKLVLFPLQPIDSDNQRWLFVPEGQLDPNVPIEETLLSSQKNSYFSPSAVGDAMTPPSSSTSSPTYTGAPVVTEFPKGLTPAKRGSHSSIYSMEAFKDYHKRVYEVGESVVR